MIFEASSSGPPMSGSPCWKRRARTPSSIARRTTTIYDRRRQNFDRHAAYVVVAFAAGG
jgi:hypothetical protein